MPTREYRGFSIAQGSRGPLPTGGGPVQVPRNMPQVRPSAALQALEGLVQFGAELANRGLANATESAYLEGQRQRSLGTALEDIEGDRAARPFIRGGYAQQDYRLNQAKFMQEMQDFIERDGRTLPPEKFVQALREGSEQIVQSIGPSMSRDDRARALASQAQAEQALIMQHGKSHKQYGLEQVSKRYTVQGNQLNAALTEARNSGDSTGYTQSAARAAMFVQDILTGDSLPEDMRAEVATQYVLSLLSTDHADIVEQAIGAGMLDTLDMDARIRIDTQLRESRSRTLARDSLAYLEGNGRFYERVANGQASLGEVRTFVQREVLAKRMTVNEAESLYQKFYKSPSDQGSKFAMFSSLLSGDLNGLHSMGSSPGEAIMALDQDMAARGVPMEQRTVQLLRAGMRYGEIPRALGQRVASATSAVAANADGVNPSQVALLNETLAMTNQLPPAAAQTLMNAVPERERAILAFTLNASKQGVAPVDAIRMATADTAQFNAMQDAQKRLVRGEFQTKVQEKLDSTFSDEVLGNKTLGRVAAFLSGQARSTDNPWMQDQLRREISEEARALANTPAHLALFSQTEGAEDALIEMAISNVAGRTLRVAEDGYMSANPASHLILPRGVPPAALFGDANVSFVSEELAKRYPPEAPGITSTFRLNSVSGRLQNVQVDEKGVELAVQDVPVQDIADSAIAREAALTKEEQYANFGGGYVLVQDSAGERHRFGTHGGNSVGVRNSDVYRWRKSLLKEAAPELPADVDETSIAVAEEQFMRSTDEALRVTLNPVKSAGLQVGSPAHLAVARAAALAGPAEFKGYTEVHAAIAERDTEALEAAVQSTDWARRDPEGAARFIQRMQSPTVGFARELQNGSTLAPRGAARRSSRSTDR